ncbi:MAG: DsrE family protein [Clostridia bacterium]|nr:DsrE family protein [Clostridia bacterium]
MDKLVVLVTTNEKLALSDMVIPYIQDALNHEWWQDIIVILWGSSVKWVLNDTLVKTQMSELIKHGVQIKACKTVANQSNTTTALRSLDFDLVDPSQELTDYLKGNYKVLTI